MAEFKEVIRKKDEICNFYVNCKDCPIYTLDCAELDKAEEIIMNWEKPEIDWSKVEVDTKILVKHYSGGEWIKRYFAKYENEKIYTFCNGTTSWNNDGLTSWTYAKLWEGNEE